jgi:leucyl-tRNA synthetase
LYDIGAVSTNEPFVKRIGTGLIQASDGRKMSKRWGNVVNPDDVIAKFGADTFRLYVMFLGPYSDSVAWNDTAIIGPRRFLEKLWRLSEKARQDEPSIQESNSTIDKSATKIAKMIADFKFNVAVPELMTLVTALSALPSISRDSFERLLKIVAPFAPHIAEELWTLAGNTNSIHLSTWPVGEITEGASLVPIALPIQIGGKVRATIYVSPDITEEEVRSLTLDNAEVKKWVGDKVIKAFIYKPGRVISIVT